MLTREGDGWLSSALVEISTNVDDKVSIIDKHKEREKIEEKGVRTMNKHSFSFERRKMEEVKLDEYFMLFLKKIKEIEGKRSEKESHFPSSSEEETSICLDEKANK